MSPLPPETAMTVAETIAVLLLAILLLVLA